MLQALGYMGATTEWRIPGDFASNLEPGEKLEFALKYAALAASEILWPSWQYELVGGGVELMVKEAPLPESVDQEGRETMIGCGVSLQFLKLTLKRLSCFGRVELFPNLDRPNLVARIYVGSSGQRDELEGQLFDALDQGKLSTTLRPQGTAGSDEIMAGLARAAERERGWLEFAQNETTRKKLHGLATRQRQLTVEEIRFRNGLAPPLQNQMRQPRRTGIAPFFKRFSHWKKPELIIKLGASAPAIPPEPVDPIDSFAGTFAMLKTKTDDKHGWLSSGQALARILLQSRLSCVSCDLHNDSLRSAQVRSALRTELGRKGFVQTILRFGLESDTSATALLACQTVAQARLNPASG